MATFDQIKEIRLTINDPEGIIEILEASTPPTTWLAQTAYLIDDQYWVETELVDIEISDARISAKYDSVGESSTIYWCIQQILVRLGKRMELVKTGGGAESTEWQTLDGLLNFYNDLLAMYKPDTQTIKTGIYLTSSRPEVAGGDI